MRLDIKGKKVSVDGYYYKGFVSRDWREMDEPEEFIIDDLELLEDFDGTNNDDFQQMTWDEQLEFLGIESGELANLCLEVYHDDMDYDPHEYDDIF